METDPERRQQFEYSVIISVDAQAQQKSSRKVMINFL